MFNKEMKDYQPQLTDWTTTPSEQRWTLIQNFIKNWHEIDLNIFENQESNLKNFIGDRDISKGIINFLLLMQKMTWANYKSPKGIYYTTTQYIFTHTYKEFLPYFDDDLQMFIFVKGINKKCYWGIAYQNLSNNDPLVQQLILDKKEYEIYDTKITLSDWFLTAIIEDGGTKPMLKGFAEWLDANKYSDWLKTFSDEFPGILDNKIDLPKIEVYESSNVLVVLKKPNKYLDKYIIRISIFKQEGQKEFVKQVSQFFDFQTRGRFWTGGWSDNVARYKL